MKKQKLVFFQDLPRGFMDSVSKGLGDYSVALAFLKDGRAQGFCPNGSGVFVQKGNRFGILTARHCFHPPGPEISLGPTGKDTLCLIVRNGSCIFVKPYEVLEHEIAMPGVKTFWPDLTFIEILPGSKLSTFKSIVSFWSLDKSADEIFQEFGRNGSPILVAGYPDYSYKTRIEGTTIHHAVRHMGYSFVIRPGNVFLEDGWDYLKNTYWYGPKNELPASFSGMSGGPIWGLKLRQHEDTGDVSLLKSALIGINFCEYGIQNNEQTVHAHFIKSIYELAWENLEKGLKKAKHLQV
jgi:hypothetical protein